MDIQSLFALKHKTVPVTGGRHGIGRATSLAFADAVADVAVVRLYPAASASGNMAGRTFPVEGGL